MYWTNIQTWTCACGQQMYNLLHLCKHLVHAVSDTQQLSPQFWTEVLRQHVLPLYRHRELGNTDIEEDGSITDGDDQIWFGNSNVLRGGGQWKNIFKSSSILRKHILIEDDAGNKNNKTSEERPCKQAHLEPSAPDEAPECTDDNPIDLISSDDLVSGENLEEEEIDEETEESVRFMLQRATELEEAARIIREQAPFKNRQLFNTYSPQ
ncbi:hypothetical protein CPB85DRAFT_1441351 [Mucidula mucida]|nr:hypothetical protein CPB85DRAFT_1441351 [Mucidula mucida]